jgi:hypothetical protein
MNTELKQSILDVLDQNIYNLRNDLERGIESNNTQAHRRRQIETETELAEAIKTRDEFVAFCG